MSNDIKPQTIDEYINQFPDDIQEILQTLRNTILDAAPDVKEKISYQMPTFALQGNLVHFAVHKNHIGFYPAPSGIEAFADELSVYESSKGAVRFPIDQPLPHDLIGRIVKFRLEENLQKANTKSKKKKNT
jgi:uncharacterized protein YdhG (YjbR/CyaY superfamily)